MAGGDPGEVITVVDFNSIVRGSDMFKVNQADDSKVREDCYCNVAQYLRSYRLNLPLFIRVTELYLSKWCIDINLNAVKDFLSYISTPGDIEIPENVSHVLKPVDLQTNINPDLGFLFIDYPIIRQAYPPPEENPIKIGIRYNDSDKIGYQHLYASLPSTNPSSVPSSSSTTPLGSPVRKQPRRNSNTMDTPDLNVVTDCNLYHESFKKVCQYLADWDSAETQSEIVEEHLTENRTCVKASAPPQCDILIFVSDDDPNMDEICLSLAKHLGIIFIENEFATRVANSPVLITTCVKTYFNRLKSSHKSKTVRFLRKVFNEALIAGKSNIVITRRLDLSKLFRAQFKARIFKETREKTKRASDVSFDVTFNYRQTPENLLPFLNIMSTILEMALKENAFLKGVYRIQDNEKSIYERVKIPIIALIPLYVYHHFKRITSQHP